MKDILVLLPVKTNSKRLPNKNLKLLCDKPLFIYALEAANEFCKNNEILPYITADDEEVFSIASDYVENFNTILRPKYLTEDPYQLVDVCLHAIIELRSKGKQFETLVVVQPSNPFVTEEDIDTCYWRNVSFSNTVRSVYKIEGNIYNKSGNLLCGDLYKGNGSIVVINIFKFLNTKEFEYNYLYEMPKERSIDIDFEIDFLIAKELMQRRIENG